MRCPCAPVRIMAEGNISDPLTSWLASASLAPLNKKDNSHRPVAVGETLRRLTAKALWAAVSVDTCTVSPSNGGTENGCEATVHTIRKLALVTRQWRQTMPPDHGFGRRLQPTRPIFFFFRKSDKWQRAWAR